MARVEVFPAPLVFRQRVHARPLAERAAIAVDEGRMRGGHPRDDFDDLMRIEDFAGGGKTPSLGYGTRRLSTPDPRSRLERSS
ncbi:MAG: hypothetical protein ACLQKA_14240 [Bryobacteraceae bacterium]